MMHINVIVYCEDTDNIDMCVKNEECSIDMAGEAPTIYILCTHDGTYYNEVKFMNRNPTIRSVGQNPEKKK